jgi:hypothetical protein
MAVVLAAGAAAAQDLGSKSFAGGVSLLSPEQTGFLYGGTAEVTGLGSAAVVISAQKAVFNMTGFSNSGAKDNAVPQSEANANSGVLTTFDFDRTVTASASGIGAGRVQARGEANAMVGAVGSAFADTTSNQITRLFDNTTPASPVFLGSESTTSNATSESAASLVGEGSTSVLAGLIGTGNGFVGSTGTSVVSTQSGIAYSALSALGDNAGSGIDIGPGAGINFAALSSEIANLGAGKGVVGFSNTLTIGSPIDLAVANISEGTISLGASTGGFFGGGAATSGQSGFASVFTAP